MPLLQTVHPVGRVSGRLKQNDTTYTWNRGQGVLRAQANPANPDTADQQAIRSIFSIVTKNWKLLTQVQRDAWTAWASAHTVTNRLGTVVSRNGMSAYVELATMHYVRTSALLSAAPTVAQPSAPSGITIPAAQAEGNTIEIQVAHGYTTLTGLYLVTRATSGTLYESQHPKLGDYRLVEGVVTTSIDALGTTGASYTYSPSKYAYSDNQYVGVECTIMNAEGWQSTPFRVFEQYTV